MRAYPASAPLVQFGLQKSLTRRDYSPFPMQRTRRRAIDKLTPILGER